MKDVVIPWRPGIRLRLVLVMVLWAICFPLITAGIDSAPHLSFAAMRAFLAGVALLAVGVILGKPFPVNLGIWGMIGLVGISATTLGFLGMFHAAEFVSPGIATVIASSQPLMASVLAYIFLRERLDIGSKTGLLLGFLGIVFIAIAGSGIRPDMAEDYVKGIGYIVAAALGITVGNVVMKYLAGRVDALMAMGVQLILGAIPLAVLSLAMENPSQVRWTLSFGAVLLGLALLGTSLVFWLWFSVLEEVDLSRANAFSFLVPIFGLAIGVSMFDETFDWMQAVGAMLSVGGIALVSVNRNGSVQRRGRMTGFLSRTIANSGTENENHETTPED